MRIGFDRKNAFGRIGRRAGCQAGLLLVVATLCSVASAASCPPLKFPAIATAAWEDDTAYEMTVRDLGGGKLRITVVGDILLFDSARFTSLVRSVDKAPGNVAELVLDARVVRIVEPLSLQSGTVRIQAQTVAFEGLGRIALTRPPGAASDGFEINAQLLDMRKALPVPLQVTVAPGSPRQVSVRARSLIAPSGTLEGAAAARWLWQRSTNFDGALPANLPSSWAVDVGDKGLANAFVAMRPAAAWPAYTAYKLRKFHGLAPFDETNQKMVRSRIDELRPMLRALERAEVLVDVDTLSRLMDQNLDRRGFGPEHVPSEDLVVAMDRFRVSRTDARKHLADLRTLILSAHQVPKLDVAELDRARKKIQTLSESQARREAEIGDAFTALAKFQADAVEAGKQIEIQREVSRQRLEELKEKDKDLANIKTVTTVVAIGASFIGTPAAGAAIAAGVGVVGDAVYAHNAGKPLNVETFVTVAAKNAALYAQMKEAQTAWDQYRADSKTMDDVFNGKVVKPKDAEKPLTKTDAATLAGESGLDFAKKLKVAIDATGSIPKPDSIELNGVEAENGALQEQLARLASIQGEMAGVTQTLKGLQAALTADNAALAETRQVEQVLLELKPANDQEVMRWKTAALQLWATNLQRLYQDAMDLRRSLYFETWKTPVLPADVLTYPEEFTAYLAAGRYSPENPNATSPTALTEAHLNNEINKHMAVLDAIASAIDQSWQTYQAERAAGAQPYFDPQEIAGDAAAPKTMQLFMDQVNAQIRRQIEFPDTRFGYKFPLLIPFDMTPPPVAGLPERLLIAGVVEPRFANGPQALAGKEISFDITYRLAGELRRNTTCAYVDLSVPGGRTTVTRRDSTSTIKPVDAVLAEYSQPLTFADLRKSRAAPPARTLYFLSVTVGGSPQHANWSNVPQLQSFKFWRSIVQ